MGGSHLLGLSQTRNPVLGWHVRILLTRSGSLSSTKSGGEGWGEEVLLRRLINCACFVLNSQAITQRECGFFASRPSP